MDAEAKFLQAGEAIDYTPATAKTAGEVVQTAGLAGICVAIIAASAKGAVQVKGIIEVKKKQEAFELGNVVGWDENGDPYGDTAGTGAATLLLADADFKLGTVIEDAASTAATVKVALNVFLPQAVIFEGMTFETVSVDKTLDIQDVGKAFIVDTDAKTITLPATAAGGRVAIINGGADAAVAVNVSPAAADKIMGPDIAGANDKDLINTKATAKQGDFVIIEPDVAGDGWHVTAIRGTWATEG
ncbi:MAG: DUF2190 family protein [Planctomycetes bacterium]|nr:DUF2190 family protein [Planctomycetota bacterium]